MAQPGSIENDCVLNRLGWLMIGFQLAIFTETYF